VIQTLNITINQAKQGCPKMPLRGLGVQACDTNHSVFKGDFIIFHQNIRGVGNKTDEIVNTIATNPPHVLCFTEHHLKTYQLDKILLQNYKLGANFVGKYTEMVGSVNIFTNFFNSLI